MGEHDHCDRDPIECSYEALVGEYREAVAERDRLRTDLTDAKDAHAVTWKSWKEERRKAIAAEAERDRLRGELSQMRTAVDVRAVAELADERDRLRAVVEALLAVADPLVDDDIEGYDEMRGQSLKVPADSLRALALAVIDARSALDVSGDMGGQPKQTQSVEHALRSIVRKISEGNVVLEPYGPGRPDMAGTYFLGTDYGTIDLTAEEAELFADVAGHQDEADR